MSEIEHRKFVPDSAIPTMKVEILDTVSPIQNSRAYGEITKVRWFLGGVLSVHDPEYVEKACAAIADESTISIASWFNDEVSGLVLAEKMGDNLLVTDLVLRDSRQGSGPRARKLIECAIGESNAQSLSLVCSDEDKQFFTELFGEGPVKEFEEEGETQHLFSTSVEEFKK